MLLVKEIEKSQKSTKSGFQDREGESPIAKKPNQAENQNQKKLLKHNDINKNEDQDFNMSFGYNNKDETTEEIKNQDKQEVDLSGLKKNPIRWMNVTKNDPEFDINKGVVYDLYMPQKSQHEEFFILEKKNNKSMIYSFGSFDSMDKKDEDKGIVAQLVDSVVLEDGEIPDEVKGNESKNPIGFIVPRQSTPPVKMKTKLSSFQRDHLRKMNPMDIGEMEGVKDC